MKRAPVHARKLSGLAALLLGFGLGLVLAFSSPATASPAVAGQVDCTDPGEAGVPECATTTTDPGTTTTLGRNQTAAPARPATTSGALAFTGGDIAGLAAIGAGAAAGGVALLAASRRRRAGGSDAGDAGDPGGPTPAPPDPARACVDGVGSSRPGY